jgi:hypothetical protein
MTEPFDAHIAHRAGGGHGNPPPAPRGVNRPGLPTRPPRGVIRRIVMAPRGQDQE